MQKSKMISVLGETNSGKSTLVNALVGQKVSIVSRKVQTTIFNVMGIITEVDSQIILVDTPGFFRKKGATNYGRLTWDAFKMSEIGIFVIDASKKDLSISEQILQKIDLDKKITLIINKIDLVHKPELLKIADSFSKIRNFDKMFMVSSTKNNGIDKLKSYLLSCATEGDWLFDEGLVTDQSTNTYIAEITREHVYDLLHEEIPYSLKVKTLSVESRKSGGWKILQEIIVPKDSYKPIVIGKDGDKIKSIGSSSRAELQEILNCPVQLFLSVRIEKDT